MKVLLQQLYGMASMTAMDAKIEEQLLHATGEDRELLQKIYESNDLDEREALIAEALGYHEHALALFLRVQAKQLRKQEQPAFVVSGFLSSDK